MTIISEQLWENWYELNKIRIIGFK